jgi:hypothetical protein
VIESGIHEVSLAPAVRVYHSASQSTTTGVTLTLAFNSERFDQVAGAASTQHDTVTNNSRLTCRYAGVYLIFGMVVWDNNATGSRSAVIKLNGTTSIGQDLRAGVAFASHTFSTIYSLAVNDYVELLVNQNSGGALNVLTDPQNSPEFGMVRVG